MRHPLLGGLAALVLVTGSGALASPAAAMVAVDGSASSVARDSSGIRDCLREEGSSAKVMEGASKWHDPNTLTREQAAALESQTQRILARAGSSLTKRPNGSVKIPVDYHVVTDREGNGAVSRARLYAQNLVLNRAFAGRTSGKSVNTPFRFRVNSISRTKSNRWFNANYYNENGQAKLREMKKTLRVGDATHLNFYTVGFGKSPLLGYATFPAAYERAPRQDGVVLLHSSLPGGTADFGPGAVYNEGDTATHEVGHWLNIYHTFQGGCGPLNDRVADTPRQAAKGNIFECDPRLDTCGPHGRSSRDPVHNFMNYTDDPCLTEFTRGQRDRMNFSWYIRQALA